MLILSLEERLEREEKEKQEFIKKYEAQHKAKRDGAIKASEIKRQKAIAVVRIYVEEHKDKIPTPYQLFSWLQKSETQKVIDAIGIYQPKDNRSCKRWISWYNETAKN